MSKSMRDKIADIALPTEVARKQVLQIFEELAVLKREVQSFFTLSEVYFVVKQVWEGEDQPSMEDLEFYLDDACVTYPAQYKKDSRQGYRYIMRRDH